MAGVPPLFGRAEELAAVLARLSDPSCRLLTLTGRGGVGKTRLAMAVAAELERRDACPIVFLELDRIRDPGLVLSTIAEALDVTPLTDLDAGESVVRRLRDDDVVLVLDNFEHVIGAAHEIADLADRCAGLTVLVTSQAPLELVGEEVVALAPLPVPAEGRVDPRDLATQPAVAVYCAQASAVDRGFVLDASTAPDVAALCRWLEGLPLAIELAAARAATLPAREILRRFESDQLSVLRRRSEAGTPRRHDLRTAISWSFGLLDATEQRLLRRLSVFTGSFGLDAVEAFADAGSPAEAFDLLGSLVDVHLVDPVHGAARARFTLPSSIREFGAEQMRIAGEEVLVRRSHVELRARDARAAAAAFDAVDEAGALRALIPDHDDLFAATQVALDEGLVDEALELIAGSAPLWDVRGFHAAHAAVTERALALVRERPVVSAAHADVLLWSALLGLRHGGPVSPDELADRLRRGEEMARTLGVEASIIRALEFWMLSAPYTGEFGRALEAAQEGLARAAISPDEPWLGRIQVLAGMLAHVGGENEQACALGVAALRHARRMHDRQTIVLATMLLTPLVAKRPELAGEVPTTLEALELARESGLVLYEALLLPSLFAGLAGRDDPAALRYAEESLTSARAMPGSPIVGYNLLAASSLTARRGDVDVAARLHGVVLEGLADLERTMAPEHVRARRVLLERARAELGTEQFDAAVRQGTTLTLDEGLEEALAYVVRERARLRAGHEHDDEQPMTDAFVIPAALTERRRDVLRLLVEGLPNKEIATRLGLTPKTVMHHTTTIYRILGVRGRSEAVAWALRAGVAD